MAGLGDDASEGIGDEAASPELEARAFGALHGDAVVDDVAVFEAYAVDCADEDSIGDGVGASIPTCFGDCSTTDLDRPVAQAVMVDLPAPRDRTQQPAVFALLR